MIRIYTITTGPLEFLAYQKATFGRFLEDEFELVVVNDGQSDEAADAIDGAARALALRCERTALPPCGDPSIGLAAALEFALRAIARDEPELALLVHADVFACSRFSLERLFADADVLAHPESKSSPDGSRVVEYPWSGVIGLRPARLPSFEAIGFAPGEVDGVRCDTGGMFAPYADRHPALRIRALDKARVYDEGDDGQLLPGASGAVTSGRGVELVAGVLLHYLGGSGWFLPDAAAEDAKRTATLALLDRLLESGSGLGAGAPVASPWPGRTS